MAMEFLDELGYPREITKNDVVSAFLKTIQRTMNCLSAEDQKSRRVALERIHVYLLKDDGLGSLPPLDVLQAAWDQVILERVLRCVADPTEKCRELAIQLIKGVAESLTEVDCTLKGIIRVMAERMGQVPVLEDSEEIRLQLFSLLIDILLPECDLPTLQNIIDPLHRIVAVTLSDHFHEVKKSACSVLVITTNRDPNVFGNKAGVFLKALIPCLSHSHSRVRIAVFQAIDALVQCGLTANLVAQQLVPGTKSLGFDHTTSIRELFFASVANWLNYKSRTMSDGEIPECVSAGKIPRFHIPELLPLLLLGITDDCLDIATSTYEKLEGIGEIYKKFIDQLFEDRKWQERHERDLREIEEQLSSPREGDLGKSTSADAPTQGISVKEAPTAQTADRNLEFNGKETKNENEDFRETAGNNLINAIITEEKTRQIDELERDEKEEIRTEDGEMTAEIVYDSDLKDYNAHPERSRIPASHAKSRHSNNEENGAALSPANSWKEADLIEGALSAERILDTDLRLFNECQKPGVASDRDRFHVAPHTSSVENNEDGGSCVTEESQSKGEDEKLWKLKIVQSETQPRTEAHDLGIEGLGSKEENTKEGEKNGMNVLHALTNQVLQGDEDKMETVLSSSQETVLNKDTSEITDEGAVRKEDSGEAGEETLQLPKPYKGRPGAGCRLMVEAFLRPMIEPALIELKQWTTPTRLSAARLLHTLMVLAEGISKDNLDILIPAFCSAVGDDDVKVAKRVVATVHIVGFHVPPIKWLPLVLKPLSNSKTSQAQRANGLVVTAAFLYGTPRNALDEKLVEKICDKLYEKEVCCSDHSAVQNQLLSVVTNLIQVAGALCASSSFKIFVLLLQLQSVEGDAQLQKRSGRVLEALAKALGMESGRELYVQHIHSLLDIVTAGHEGWSSGLPGKLVFQTFMRNANDAVSPYLESLLPLFRVCLQSDQDPALRISFLQLLDELFEKPELDASWAPLAVDVIGKLLLPCGVWRASKTEAAVRYGAMVAIGTFLRRGLCSQEHMQEILNMTEGFIPVIKTCIDEDYFLDVRRATTHVMYQLLRVSGPILSGKLSPEKEVTDGKHECPRCFIIIVANEERTKLIKVLTKRVDDSSNTIRIAILPAVTMFFTTMSSSFSDSEVSAAISRIQQLLLAIVKTEQMITTINILYARKQLQVLSIFGNKVKDFVSFLVVHMDDEVPCIQEGVCRAIETCAMKKPHVVTEVLGGVRGHHKSPRYLDRVLTVANHVK